MIYLLNYAAPVHLKRKLKNVAVHGVRQNCLLNLCSIFEQFLDDIISENILNELEGIMGDNLVEDDFLFVAGGRLELLLNET